MAKEKFLYCVSNLRLSIFNRIVGFERRDVVVSVVVALVGCAFAIGLWFVVGLAGAMAGSLFFVLLSMTLGALWMYRGYLAALDQRHVTGSMIIRSVDNCYRQLEALQNIRSDLDIKNSLPPMRGWAISPDFAELLLRQMRTRRPVKVLECGSGVSTIVIGTFLQKQKKGHVVSLEHDAIYAEASERLINEHGLQDYARILHAPLIPYECDGRECFWYDVSGLERSDGFDFVVVDGPPSHTGELARYPLLCVMADRIAQGATILLDDAGRADEQRVLERWMCDKPEARLSIVDAEKGAAIVQLQSAGY